MTAYYADTSAILKRYIQETGSDWVRNITAPELGNMIVICHLTPVEVFWALERKQRLGTLEEADKHTLQANFLAHTDAQYLIVDVNVPILKYARDLVTKYEIRPPDAVQLASALQFAKVYDNPVTFVSSDRKLLEAARLEGLQIGNPLKPT